MKLDISSLGIKILLIYLKIDLFQEYLLISRETKTNQILASELMRANFFRFFALEYKRHYIAKN